jgi:hypothetical protein
MLNTPALIILVCLFGAGTVLFIVNEWERYRIRSTGTRVMAKVIQVHSWQENSFALDISPNTMPLIGRWNYEVITEYTDPRTNETHTSMSGRRTGLPKYQRGDYLPAYISPRGNYVELS